MSFALILVGIFGIIFRIWLTEIKLKEQLKYERFFLSRFLVLYCFGAMMLNFKLEVFNLIVTASFPMMFLCIFIFDIPFFYKIKHGESVLPQGGQYSPEKIDIWVILEKITLHIPIVILGLYFYSQGLKTVVFPSLKISTFVIVLFLVFIPFIFIDPRILKKRDWPDGFWLMFAAICTVIGFYLHFFYININL